MEYSTQKEAKAAIQATNGTTLHDQTLTVDFAFVRPIPSKNEAGKGVRGGRKGRGRSRSPGRKDDDAEE